MPSELSISALILAGGRATRMGGIAKHAIVVQGETILARHAGMRVLAFSLFTNMGCGLQAEALSHAHTLGVAGAAAPVAAGLLASVIAALEL